MDQKYWIVQCSSVWGVLGHPLHPLFGSIYVILSSKGKPGMLLQNERSKTWAQVEWKCHTVTWSHLALGKQGVSPRYVQLYIDLSLYSPLTEVISCQWESWGIPLIWLVLNQGTQEVLKAVKQHVIVTIYHLKMCISSSLTLKQETTCGQEIFTYHFTTEIRNFEFLLLLQISELKTLPWLL